MATMYSIQTTAVVVICCAAYIHAGNSWLDISKSQQLPKVQDAGVSLPLPFHLVMFGRRVGRGTNVWISSNGYLTIGSEHKKFQKVMFPLNNQLEDPLAIVAFKSRMQYRPDEDSDREASVAYTTALTASALSQIDSAIHSSVAMAAAKGYRSKHALAVSWNKISFFGGNPGHTPYPRNTFQVVLTTDGEHTFAVFNYRTIVWEGGLASGGDPNTGIGANFPHAQAGINEGSGRGFTKLHYGSNILDIDIEQASESAGQYIYELSSRQPRPHGCVTKRPDSMPLQLMPSSGPMFGGNPVEISNACFSRRKSIQCQFGKQVVSGRYLSQSKALCYAPTFYGNEQIKFKVLIDGVEVFTKDTFYLASIRHQNAIELVNLDRWRSVKPAGSLEMRWNSADLSNYKGRLNVKLFIYQESGLYYGWSEELLIEEGISNSGSYMLNPSLVKCKKDCKHKTVGAVVLELAQSPDSTHPGRLWSNVGALGWYVDGKLKSSIGKEWPAQMCYDWFLDDTRQGLDWLNELEDCPCTKDQAIGDIGRFIPDPGCNMYSKNSGSNCYYHQEAQHCVRSIWPSYPTGAGAQCCYDAQGNLLYAGDTIYGSTVDKGHSQGAAPYNAQGYVPALSHWLYDVITYQYCCLWSSMNSTCGMYMDQRPTKDCKDYQPARTAAVYGEGYIRSLNGKTHRHTHPGIYTLLLADQGHDDITVQALFTTLPAEDAPVLTGIALKSDKCSLVEITLNTAYSLRGRTTVRVDGVRRQFTDRNWSKQEYKGVQIWSGGPTPVVDQSNFTVTMVTGIGFMVTATRHNLNLIVTVPTKLMKSLSTTKSLLSGYSSDAAVEDQHSLFTPESIDYPIIDEDISSAANAVSQYADTLDMFNQPVISCGMPVRHGIRKGTAYTAGAQTELVSCRDGYELMEATSDNKYTCDSSGSWQPKMAAHCKYVGFPVFDPPTTTTKSTAAKPTTIHTTTTTPTTRAITKPTTTTTTSATTTLTTTTVTTESTSTKPVTTTKSTTTTNATTTLHSASTEQTTEEIYSAAMDYIDLVENITDNDTMYYAYAEPMVVSTQVWTPPVLTDDQAALPLTLIFSALIIFMLVLAALAHRHRQREFRKRYMSVDSNMDEQEEKGEYIMSSTGSMKVAPSATVEFKDTQETLDLNHTTGMKSYRVAVGYPPQDYRPPASTSGEESETASNNSSEHDPEMETEDPSSRLKSYRVAVDPPPSKRSYPSRPPQVQSSIRYQPSSRRGLSPEVAFDENEEDQSNSRLTSYRVAVDPPPERRSYEPKGRRPTSGRSQPKPEIVVEEVEF